MTQIKAFVFNPFQVNCFILYDDSGECVIVDPGCYESAEFESLTDFIRQKQLRPVKILNTHCHVDHILGNGMVKKAYHIPIEAHEAETTMIDNAVEMAKMIGLVIEPPPAIDHYLKDGDTVYFGQSGLEVIHVPGHSPGGLSFYSRENKFVLPGDALFYRSIGRTDLPGGDYETLINTIQTKLIPLPCETRVYPGHGPETTILSEKQNNTFIL